MKSGLNQVRPAGSAQLYSVLYVIPDLIAKTDYQATIEAAPFGTFSCDWDEAVFGEWKNFTAGDLPAPITIDPPKQIASNYLVVEGTVNNTTGASLFGKMILHPPTGDPVLSPATTILAGQSGSLSYKFESLTASTTYKYNSAVAESSGFGGDTYVKYGSQKTTMTTAPGIIIDNTPAAEVPPGGWCVATSTVETDGSTKTKCTPGLTTFATKDACVKAAIGTCSEIYNLLAPLPIIGDSIITSGGTKGLAEYINIMFRLALGVAGILAVIYIIIGGIQYMMSDSVFNKTEATKRIWGAITGLMIGLSIFIILNTLDPAILKMDFKLEPAVLSMDDDRSDDPGAIDDQTSITMQEGQIGSCVVGIEKVESNGKTFYACKIIAPKLKEMLDEAWKNGIKLSGGGFRTIEKQKELRAKNCGGEENIFNKNAKCNPITALPGKSRHESGLAFDLKCAGTLINLPAGKECFEWLSVNAGKYSLKNFPKENWHWSIDGR